MPPESGTHSPRPFRGRTSPRRGDTKPAGRHENSTLSGSSLVSGCVFRGRCPRLLNRSPAAIKAGDWKSTRLNSSHLVILYAVFCLKTYANIFTTFMSQFDLVLSTSLLRFRDL